MQVFYTSAIADMMSVLLLLVCASHGWEMKASKETAQQQLLHRNSGLISNNANHIMRTSSRKAPAKRFASILLQLNPTIRFTPRAPCNTGRPMIYRDRRGMPPKMQGARGTPNDELSTVTVGGGSMASKNRGSIGLVSKPTAVYALILANFVAFLADKFSTLPSQRLYLNHGKYAWWNLLTSLFLHADRSHLSNNIFYLLIFGRSVEDELGWGGLLLSYLFCGVLANVASLALLPAATMSMGASGAVFGLFTVSIFSRLRRRNIGWRNLIEIAVLGEFVVGTILKEMRTTAAGGIIGVNHVAHLAGAGAGMLLVVLLRTSIAMMEGKDSKDSKDSKGQQRTNQTSGYTYSADLKPIRTNRTINITNDNIR